MNAAELLTDRARLTPGREALYEVHTGTRYTYRQLNERACRVANAMLKLGVKHGDRVSILAHNSAAYVDLLYGLAKIGAVFAPLNWRLVARELVYIVNDCTPHVLICGPEFTEILDDMHSEIDVPHIVGIEGAQIGDAPACEDLCAAASAAEPPRPGIHPDDTCAILYTSGTTGRPKGAMIPHRQVLWNCINTVASWGLDAGDCSPVFTPMFHAGGLFAFLTPLFFVGGRIVLARDFDVEDTLRMLVDEGCTVILGVPTIFQMWMNSPAFEQVDFAHVKFFISGGAPCPPPLINAWREAKNVVFRQGYGLTEVGVNCFSMTDDDSVRKVGSVGKPIMNSRVRLVDSDGRDAQPGSPGEIAITGPHVCTGYWGKPDATADVLRDGWFHTGDMGQVDEDGFFRIIGRAKDMIISGGENVYAAEVEAVFREHPAVEDAALIGKPDDKWGEVGLMVVQFRPGQLAEPADLLAFCSERLARYKVPKEVAVIDLLPYSPYGKVVKAELRARYIGEGVQS